MRTPSAHKAIPPGLIEGSNWTGFTDFKVITTASSSTTPLPALTTEAAGEAQDTEMPAALPVTEDLPEKPDEWKIQDGYLVRIHNKKRTALFTPFGLKDSPKLPEEFTGTRITRYKWTGQDKVNETEDNFTGPQAHSSLRLHLDQRDMVRVATEGRDRSLRQTSRLRRQPAGTISDCITTASITGTRRTLETRT